MNSTAVEPKILVLSSARKIDSSSEIANVAAISSGSEEVIINKAAERLP